MEKVRIGKGKSLYIILLDSSSSMRMEKKIKFTKTLAYLLLKQSYEKRNRVALICFRGDDARLLVPPVRDVMKIEKVLKELPTGGKTPLTPALYKAFLLSKKENKEHSVIILISDGKGNVFIKNSFKEDVTFLQKFIDSTKLIIINAENKNKSIGILEKLSKKFNSPHFYLENII